MNYSERCFEYYYLPSTFLEALNGFAALLDGSVLI